jgi:hypothetical protein
MALVAWEAAPAAQDFWETDGPADPKGPERRPASPAGYLPPTAWEAQVTDPDCWLDLCA